MKKKVNCTCITYILLQFYLILQFLVFFGITLTPFNKMVLINGYNFMLNDEIAIFFFSTLTQPHNILVPNPP